MTTIEDEVNIPLVFGGYISKVTLGNNNICIDGKTGVQDLQFVILSDSIDLVVYYEGIKVLDTMAFEPPKCFGLRTCAGKYRVIIRDLSTRDQVVVYDKTFYYEGDGAIQLPTGLMWTNVDERSYCILDNLRGTDGNFWSDVACRWCVVSVLRVDPDHIWVGELDKNDWEYSSGTHVTFVREEGDYWIFQVSAGMIIEGSKFGYEEFVKVSKSKLSDWIVVRILQYLATEHADGQSAAFLNILGRSKSYPKEEISRYCPRDPSYYGDLPDRVAGLKGYYDAMVAAANEAQQIYDDWVEWACLHCKAKLAYSQYDYDMCVSEWEQKLRGAYQKYISAKTTRDGFLEDLKLEPLFECFMEAFPEYAEYMKDPPIQTMLPDCSIPLPKLRNVVIDSSGIYFEYYAPIEMTVLICLGRVEDSTVRKIDCYELTAKPQWQPFSKEIHLTGGIYQLYFPNLAEYINPIRKTVTLPPNPVFMVERCYLAYEGKAYDKGQTIEVEKGATVYAQYGIKNTGGSGKVAFQIWDDKNNREVGRMEVVLSSGGQKIGKISFAVNTDMDIVYHTYYWDGSKWVLVDTYGCPRRAGRGNEKHP